MNSELTDVYAIIKREFKDEMEYFGVQNNRELAAFLHYNAHNEMLIGTDDKYYHNVNFKNLDTGRESKIFREGNLYFFPKSNDLIIPGNELTAFSINRGTKCITLNGKGFFIEKSDLMGNIVTYYYDMAALAELDNHIFLISGIDHAEKYFDNKGIYPDKIIMVENKKINLVFSIIENGEPIIQNQVQFGKNRTVYSMYYEFMKANKFYGIPSEEIKQYRLHK